MDQHWLTFCECEKRMHQTNILLIHAITLMSFMNGLRIRLQHFTKDFPLKKPQTLAPTYQYQTEVSLTPIFITRSNDNTLSHG